VAWRRGGNDATSVYGVIHDVSKFHILILLYIDLMEQKCLTSGTSNSGLTFCDVTSLIVIWLLYFALMVQK
jgi:hypothetical protein